jgi:hypothetical protein
MPRAIMHLKSGSRITVEDYQTITDSQSPRLRLLQVMKRIETGCDPDYQIEIVREGDVALTCLWPGYQGHSKRIKGVPLGYRLRRTADQLAWEKATCADCKRRPHP